MTNPTTVADRLHTAFFHLMRRLRRVDEVSGMTTSKLSALAVIVHSGPLSLGDLASAEQVRAPSMTRIVQELLADGMVTRVPDTEDRRVVRIHATPKGRRALHQGRSGRVALLASWLATLKPAEQTKVEEVAALLESLLGVTPCKEE
jgi:DNA-binding MarR family transcriptional regulator